MGINSSRRHTKFARVTLLLACHFAWSLTIAVAEPPKLGAIIGLTGGMSAWGDRCQKAYSLALNDIKSETGELPFELVIEDSPETLPKNSLTALHKLDRVDRIFTLIGVFTPEEVEALTPILERKEIGLISFVRGTTSLKRARYLWPDPIYESAAAATELRKRHKRVAILSDQASWTEQASKGFSDRFKELGGTIVSNQSLPINVNSVRTEVLKAKNSAPEALFIPSYYLFSYYVKEISILRLNIPIYGIELDDSAWELSKPYSAGVKFIRPYVFEKFDARFRSNFNIAADLPASYCYDQVRLAHTTFISLPAENRTETTLRKSFGRALESVSEYDGVSGKLIFKPTRTESPLGWFEMTSQGIVPIK